MSVSVLGYLFDDAMRDVADALQTIINNSHYDENILRDYLDCAAKLDVVPTTMEELASAVLDPALNSYNVLPTTYGFPSEEKAYEAVARDLFDPLLKQELSDAGASSYFDWSGFGKDFLQREGFILGRYGYLEEAPSEVLLSADEIIGLAHYLDGYTYDGDTIHRIKEHINLDMLNLAGSNIAQYNPQDFWVVEFNECDAKVPNMTGKVLTSQLIDDITLLDKQLETQPGYYKFYFDHIVEGNTVDHWRLDVGDGLKTNAPLYSELYSVVAQALENKIAQPGEVQLSVHPKLVETPQATKTTPQQDLTF